ncbi:MafB-related protein (plasmid) [Alkalihalophilus pseudofirmus OF4]|uniref:MafB-related protein n=1 Tax=Alkalihalophilus pseudofirmus (strain ATCC BAA-2126 / JCM 17055 / OF4) TaxID=398511 RepID=D3G211_ALKPO|nr:MULTISPECIES: SAR2788 family putative toxin [Alkalihalophilus]ADC52387.1 MafB-related protein [Alkalihalophilus pseudofirmus OF4]MED1603436.1 SAR2788 family putative toxin [Alkalihalophilus marmarensis]
MNKYIIRLLIFFMIFPLLPNYNVVKASTETDDHYQQELVKEFEKDLEYQLGQEISKEINTDIKLTSEEIVIEIGLEEEAVSVDVVMDFETELFTVESDVLEDDNIVTNTIYDVIVHESEEDVFIATFVNQESGEIYDMDTTELEASALPLVIVAAVARHGIQYAIKKYGKKAAQNAVSSRSFNTVLSSVKNIDANKRAHILANKHDWHKVTKNNWTDVSKVMSHVMRYGKESAYGSARKKTLSMSGQTVTVTFTRVNGQVRISNGWVNK